MARLSFCGFTVVVLTVVGCLGDDPKFGDHAAKVPTPKLPPGSLAAATRVDSLGRKILAANSEITIRPMFTTVGVPDIVLFHRGMDQICISDGLVDKCKSDEELAAVLCAELGKMVAEGQARQQPLRSNRETPLAPVVGNDVVGGGGDTDASHLAEQVIFEKKNPRKSEPNFRPGRDPSELASRYLGQTGYDSNELLKVMPLLHMAEANPKYQGNGSASGLGIPNAP